MVMCENCRKYDGWYCSFKKAVIEDPESNLPCDGFEFTEFGKLPRIEIADCLE